MKRHIAMVTVTTVLVMLLSSIVPVQAADPDEATLPGPSGSFHALGRLPHLEQNNLTPLTDTELDSITGMAGWGGLGGLVANLGIVVQINVCAVCSNVRQTNFGVLRTGMLRPSAQ
jgi:hypothetical protein